MEQSGPRTSATERTWAASHRRDRLLFISPIEPRVSGNGLAMRAHAVLDALADRYQVELIIPGPWREAEVTDSGWRPDRGLARRARQRFQRTWPGVAQLALGRPAEWLAPSRREGSRLARLAQHGAFDLVHVFRLYLCAYAAPFLGRCRCQLDLDDLEASTRHHAALAALQDGELVDALQHAHGARFYRRLQATWLPRFDRIFVASDGDRERLRRAQPRLSPELLPNSVPTVEPLPVRRRSAGSPYRLLFVGNMNHPPNVQAVRHLARHILPRVRALSPCEVHLDVAGGRVPAPLAHELIRAGGVRLHGWVASLTPLYRRR